MRVEGLEAPPLYNKEEEIPHLPWPQLAAVSAIVAVQAIQFVVLAAVMTGAISTEVPVAPQPSPPEPQIVYVPRYLDPPPASSPPPSEEPVPTEEPSVVFVPTTVFVPSSPSPSPSPSPLPSPCSGPGQSGGGEHVGWSPQGRECAGNPK